MKFIKRGIVALIITYVLFVAMNLLVPNLGLSGNFGVVLNSAIFAQFIGVLIFALIKRTRSHFKLLALSSVPALAILFMFYVIRPIFFMQVAIEESGKIEVAKLEHTQGLVEKYGMRNIEISALYYKYIQDDEYLARLLGERFGNIDCIIPVSWPDGDLVYIEVIPEGHNHDNAEYIPVGLDEFEALINTASEDDIETFYANINNEQKFVRQVMKKY